MMPTFSIAENGTLSLIQLTSSGEWSPRHFGLNGTGNLVAVGYENNNTVVIWKRNVDTGLVMTKEAAAVVTLTRPVVCTIWDEE